MIWTSGSLEKVLRKNTKIRKLQAQETMLVENNFFFLDIRLDKFFQLIMFLLNSSTSRLLGSNTHLFHGFICDQRNKIYENKKLKAIVLLFMQIMTAAIHRSEATRRTNSGIRNPGWKYSLCDSSGIPFTESGPSVTATIHSSEWTKHKQWYQEPKKGLIKDLRLERLPDFSLIY